MACVCRDDVSQAPRDHKQRSINPVALMAGGSLPAKITPASWNRRLVSAGYTPASPSCLESNTFGIQDNHQTPAPLASACMQGSFKLNNGRTCMASAKMLGPGLQMVLVRSKPHLHEASCQLRAGTSSDQLGLDIVCKRVHSYMHDRLEPKLLRFPADHQSNNLQPGSNWIDFCLSYEGGIEHASQQISWEPAIYIHIYIYIYIHIYIYIPGDSKTP